MGSKASLGNAVKTLYIGLFLAMAGAMAELLVVQGYRSCFNLLARFSLQIAAEYTIYGSLLASWFAYRESSYIKGVIFMCSMFLLGSLPSMAYIVIQFFKLTPEELDKDPIYFVLAKRYKRVDIKGPSVTTARVIYFILIVYMIGILMYTIFVDNIYVVPDINKCLVSNVIDIHVHFAAISVWVAYKESTWKSAFYWILFVMTFRGLAVCIYVLRQLLYLSPDQPVSLIIFNNKNRDLETTDPLLMVHPTEV